MHMKFRDIIEKITNERANILAAIEDKTFHKVMRIGGFDDHKTMQKAGYRVVREQKVGESAYYILCKDVHRERVPHS